MKVKTRLKLLCLLIGIMGVCSILSCSKEEIASEDDIPAGFGKLTLKLTSLVASSPGAGEGSQAENLITQANLFVFKDSILEKAVLDITNFAKSANGPEMKSSFI